MSCSNLEVPKPIVASCVSPVFGIPCGATGRVVASTPFEIQGIVLHCYPGTISQLCNELKCKSKSSVVSGSVHNSFHYGIGTSGHIRQFVDDGDIAWGFGAYTKNSYIEVPPPNEAINWPTLQGVNGVNTTPDVYILNVAIALGAFIDATTGCFVCPSNSGLPITQHDELIQLLAYLAETYSIPIDSEHITFHDLIACDTESNECPCIDIDALLAEVVAYCPPCKDNAEAVNIPESEIDDVISHYIGITDACCPDSVGCLVKVPVEESCLELDANTPLEGCGIVGDELTLNLCSWGDYIPDQAADTLVNVAGLDDAGCLIEVPAADLVELYITCDNVINLFEAGTVFNLLGIDDAGDCVSQDITTAIQDVICSTPVDVVATPQYLLAQDDEDNCPVFVTPENVVAAGLEINLLDTCIDASMIDNVLNIGVILNTAESDNIVQCNNGLYVPDITVSDGFCVHLNYNPATRNINADLFIYSVAADNIAECISGTPGVDSGLYVPDLNVTDTDCIDLTYAGRNLSADIILAPTQVGVPNAIQCIAGQGLYVPELSVADTNCIDLTYAAGQLSADVIINPAADNQIDCGVNGLYVPELAGLQVSDTDCLNLDLTGVVLSGTITLAGSQAGVPNTLQCIPGQGLYVPEVADLQVLDTACMDLNLINGVLTANPIISATANNQISCAGDGLYVPLLAGLVVADTNCIDLTMTGSTLTADPILAPTQGGIPNAIQCLANGLYAPEYCEWTVLSNGDCSGGVGGEYTVTEFEIDPALCTITVNSEPRHHTVEACGSEISIDFANFNGNQPDILPIILLVTNPSDCRDMILSVNYSGADAYFSSGAAAPPHTFYAALLPNVRIDGVIQYADLGRADFHINFINHPADRVTINGSTQGLSASAVIGPGVTSTIDSRSRLDSNATTIPEAQVGGASLCVLGVTI